MYHPVAFAVAGHLDINGERSCYGSFGAPTNLLLAIGIFPEQGDGIVAATFAETEEIALRRLREIGVVGTEPHVGIVVSRRAEGLTNPKLPLHRLILRDGQGKIGRACIIRIQLKLLAPVYNIHVRRPRPNRVLGEVAIREVIGDLGEQHHRKQQQNQERLFHGINSLRQDKNRDFCSM